MGESEERRADAEDQRSGQGSGRLLFKKGFHKSVSKDAPS